MKSKSKYREIDNYIKNVIRNKSPGIDTNTIFDRDLVDHIKSYNLTKTELRKLLAGIGNPTNKSYSVDYNIEYHHFCTCCKKVQIKKCSKTKLYELLASDFEEHSECENCRDKRIKAEQERNKTTEYGYGITDEELLGDYVQSYLSERVWNDGINTREKIYYLSRLFYARNHLIGIVSDYIQSLDYKYFLETPYWKAIAEKVRKRDRFICKLCGGKGVDVHHSYYSIHGNELFHTDKLITLCRDCHSKYHNK